MRTTILVTLLIFPALAQSPPAWVERSNRNAQLLIAINAKYSPESAAEDGVPGIDDQTAMISTGRLREQRADLVKARAELESRFNAEKDPLVRQDLRILMDSADRDIRGLDAREKTYLPYTDVASRVFFGTKSLLDDQIAPERLAAVVVRLKKYAGMEPGLAPITAQAEERFREKLNTPGLVGPSKMAVEKDLGNTQTYINGIGLLLEKYKMQGYQEAYAKLKDQLTAYDAFVRKEVLPRAREDFRVPPAIYGIALENYGVDYAPDRIRAPRPSGFRRLPGADAGDCGQGGEAARPAFIRLSRSHTSSQEGATER